MKPPARLLLRWSAVAALLGVALLTLLAGCQSQMIYFPTKRADQELRREAAAAGWLPWTTVDGRLIGWRTPGGSGAPRVLAFHGNAGMASNRRYLASGFRALGGGGWEFFVMEYPGYGARPGSPGEKSFAAAGREALAELRRENARPVYLLGESIGSGTAAKLAGEFPDQVAGVILVTPFTSLTDTAAHHYPWAPVRLVLRDRYDNAAALAQYRGPVAVILAGQDEVVPTALGQRLYDGYPHRKKLWVQETAGHNDLDYTPAAPWWGEMARFLLEEPG